VPLVIRGPGGVGRQLGAEHSQRLESYFQSIPGVQLVACSTAANAKALLKSAIRSDNPIIFFEHVLLYNVKGELGGKSHQTVAQRCDGLCETALNIGDQYSSQGATWQELCMVVWCCGPLL
jgi:pyruvate dehydrogenase E1 component beta subunit